jgi:hypothetical protein
MPKEAKPGTARSISLEDFTELTLQSVLRAVEARKLPHGPIIIGIIWLPEGFAQLGKSSPQE